MVRETDDNPILSVHAPQAKAVRTETIAFAVVGVGRMGANHVGALADLDGAELVTLCDQDEATAKRIAQKSGLATYYTDLDRMIAQEQLDAVIVATTTQQHAEVAMRCMNAGLHVLLEKPMSTSPTQCRELIRTALKNRVRLMIGHVERFNPAIRQVKTFLDDRMIGGLYYIETERSGPFPKRLYGHHDGVVIDLAVHDLDLVHHLVGPLTQVYAHLIQTGSSNQDVYSRVMYRTDQDVLGSSEFSWISPRRQRTVSVYGDNGMLFADLQQQEVWYFENGEAGDNFTDNYYQNVLWGRVSEGMVTKFPIKREDPLRNEISHFCRLIQNPSIDHDPSYGLEAIRYVIAALESARSDRIIYFDQFDDDAAAHESIFEHRTRRGERTEVDAAADGVR